MHDEIDSLKRDKHVLMLELVRLRQQQQAMEQRMRDMAERVESTEHRQNAITTFLARVAQNPSVLQQMMSVAQSSGLTRLASRNGGAHACVSRLPCTACAAATNSSNHQGGLPLRHLKPHAAFTSHHLAAARKKRRGSGPGSDGTGDGNSAAIIQYTPTNGDFPDSFLRSLAQATPSGGMPPELECMFTGLQLGQVRVLAM